MTCECSLLVAYFPSKSLEHREICCRLSRILRGELVFLGATLLRTVTVTATTFCHFGCRWQMVAELADMLTEVTAFPHSWVLWVLWSYRGKQNHTHPHIRWCSNNLQQELPTEPRQQYTPVFFHCFWRFMMGLGSDNRYNQFLIVTQLCIPMFTIYNDCLHVFTCHFGLWFLVEARLLADLAGAVPSSEN